MFAEIIGMIVTGVAVVEGVTNIIRNLKDINEPNITKDIETSLENIQGRLTTVECELKRPEPSEPALMEAYSALISALQQDKNYSSQLYIVKTDYGTWKIMRKRSRKPTVLRDPNGEYC